MILSLTGVGRVQGALVMSGPAIAIYTYGLSRLDSDAGVDPKNIFIASALVTLGGLFFSLVPRAAKMLSTLGAFGALFLLFPFLINSPPTALTTLIGFSILLNHLWATRSLAFRSSRAREIFRMQAHEETFRTSCLGCIVIWLLALIFGLAFSLFAQLIALSSVLLCALLGLRWAVAQGRNSKLIRKWIWGGLIFFAATAALLYERPALLITIWLYFPLGSLFFVRTRNERPSFSFIVGLILEHPARLLVFTFSILSVLGTFVLYLPESSTSPGSIGFVDAAFTAVSAVCVTGLIVLDTPKDFTLLGQGAILTAIQVGGLGIMTFYTAAFAVLGRRVSLRHERALGQVIGGDHIGQVVEAIRKILVITFGSEVVGALILASVFYVEGESIGSALWRGIFTAVSAFCNAGFALQTDSLIPYQQSPIVLHTVGTLIMIGGLSPMAVSYLPQFIARRPVPLQAKLIIWSAATLLVVGVAGFLAIEWSNTLSGLSYFDRFTNAWFQSVTTRTAGFNSLDISAMKPASLLLVIVLMWIGGSPGGTAGGIKTTTVALLILAVSSAFKGTSKVVIFGRTVPHSSIYRSAAVMSASVLTALFALLALLLTQSASPGDLFFEVISALGTVGLSVGATAQLDQVGKVLIIICMFAGRVGPLTLFLLLAGHARVRKPWRLPEEDVAVG